MADAGLKIVIGADIGGVVTAINKLTAAIAGIEPAANNAAAMLSKIPASLRPIDPKKMQDLSNAVQRLKQDIAAFPRAPIPDPFKEVPKGANQATQALTNVGRVAQDLPYGFIGIANNLNPLLESFQRLKAETGSTKGALKALGSSLAGAGGIGLALSVVSSAFLIFGNSTRGAKKELEGYAKAIDEANKTAGEEIARVQVLNAVISDNTRTQSERKKASKELSGILKDLNINLSQEAILNGQVAEATKKATDAIIERAKARAIENRIGEISGQQLQRDIQRASATDKLAKAQKNLIAQEKIRQNVIGGGSVPGISGNTTTASLAVNKLQNEIASLDKATAEANKEIGFLIGQIKSSDLTVDLSKGAEKEVDLLKQRIAALKELQGLTGLDAKQRVELAQLEIQLAKRDGLKLGFTKAEIQQQVKGILEQAFPVAEFEFPETVLTPKGLVLKLDPSKVKGVSNLQSEFNPTLAKFQTDIAAAVGIGDTIEIPAPKITFTNTEQSVKDALAGLNKTIATLTENIQVEAFATIGEAIGTAITGGDVQKVFVNFFSFLADGLVQLGKALIAYGIALVGFKVAVKSLNPVVALIAGTAAVAAGVAVKASLPKFADGGIVTGPVIGQIGEMHKPEVIMPLDRLKALMGSAPGNDNTNSTPLLLMRNEGLYFQWQRGERRANRRLQ